MRFNAKILLFCVFLTCTASVAISAYSAAEVKKSSSEYSQSNINAFFEKNIAHSKLASGANVWRKMNKSGFITSFEVDQNADNKVDAEYFYNADGSGLVKYNVDRNFDRVWDQSYVCTTKNSKKECNYKIDINLDGKMDFAFDSISKKKTILDHKLYNKLAKTTKAGLDKKQKQHSTKKLVNHNLSPMKLGEARSIAAIPGYEAGLPANLTTECNSSDSSCIIGHSNSLIKIIPKWEKMIAKAMYYKHITGDKEPTTQEEKKLNAKYSEFRRTKYDFLIHESCDKADVINGKNNYMAETGFEVLQKSFDFLSRETLSTEHYAGRNFSHHIPKLFKLLGSNHPDNMPKIVCEDMFFKEEGKLVGSKDDCATFGLAGYEDIDYYPAGKNCKINDISKCKAVPKPVMYLALEHKNCKSKEAETYYNNDTKEEFAKTFTHEMFHLMEYDGLAILAHDNIPYLEYPGACALAIFPQFYKLKQEKLDDLAMTADLHCRNKPEEIEEIKEDIYCELSNLCRYKVTHDSFSDESKRGWYCDQLRQLATYDCDFI